MRNALSPLEKPAGADQKFVFQRHLTSLKKAIRVKYLPGCHK